MGIKAYITAADLIYSDGDMHCFMLPLSSCYINLRAGFSCLSGYEHTAISFFFD